MSGISIRNILQEWRGQTLKETAALRAQDWEQVQACQAVKTRLQKRLDGLAGVRPSDDQVQRLVDDLLKMEAGNGKWLSRQLAALQTRRRKLESSSANLKEARSPQLRPGHANWHAHP
jgi:hypothetical protein